MWTVDLLSVDCVDLLGVDCVDLVSVDYVDLPSVDLLGEDCGLCGLAKCGLWTLWTC